MEIQADMNEAVMSALQENRVLGKISAEIRAEVSLLLNKDAERPRSIPLCRENMIINELIREYLERNGLHHTLSVFVPETGEPADPMDRNFLAHSLNIIPKGGTPLINSLVRKWRGNDEEISLDQNPEKPKREPYQYCSNQQNSTDNVNFFEIKSV